MKNIEIDERYSFMCKSVSKGAQKKYFKDGWYYKVDRIGREGMKECLPELMFDRKVIQLEAAKKALPFVNLQNIDFSKYHYGRYVEKRLKALCI